MIESQLYALLGVLLLSLGFYSLVVNAHLVRKLFALNVAGAGVFLFLVALANTTTADGPDPVPHAMVLTGIVVAISATALGLALTNQIYIKTGSAQLSDNSPEEDV